MRRGLWVTNMWPDRHRPWYGSFVSSQAESLRAIGMQVDLVYMPGYLDKREYLRGLFAMRQALGRGRYDLVHAHYGHSGAIARLQLQVPLVISFCGDDLLGTRRADSPDGLTLTSRLLAAALAQLPRVASATITKSQVMAARLPLRCRARNHVIPNGVDLSTFAPADSTQARHQLGWS